MTTTFQDFSVYLLSIALVYYIWARRNRANSLPHPPGPPGLPFIGNLRDIPPDPAWNTYIDWSRKYGSDIVRLNVFGSNIIITNSLKSTLDLLERRSSNYSDRPDMVMLNELCGFGWNSPFQHYGNEWKGARKAYNQVIGKENIKQFRNTMLESTHTFLRNLTQRNADVMSQLRLFAGLTVMKIAYGIDILSENDPYIVTAEHALQVVSVTTNAGAYLVDTLPFLKYIPSWFPGAQFKRDAKRWKLHVDKMKDDPWEAVKDRQASGDLSDCAATLLLDEIERNPNVGYDEQIVKHTCGSMYTGGADTTVSSLGSFFLAMLLHPEVQLKAQQQIDEVCSGRLPDFSDRLDLPYVEALVMESLRWHPVVPLCVAHRSMADDIYNGFFIPKGSVVVANSWAILHDENVYTDPQVFNPDRFLKDGKIDSEVQDPMVAAFGFGRRLCAGRHLAIESMWIAIASTLASCTISRAKDRDGKVIIPEEEYLAGFLCYPRSFKCDIRPRSVDHAALLAVTSL